MEITTMPNLEINSQKQTPIPIVYNSNRIR
jgi:hypothetical protein